MVKIAPSLLASDFARLADEIADIEAAGADLLHLDIMDGHFVPNITIGPCVVEAVKRSAKIPLHVHLMIEDPERYFADFVKAGADIVIFHMEIDIPHAQLTEKIREAGASPGVSLNPETPVVVLEPVRDVVDDILVMSVHPGFGGQKFIPDSLGRIRQIREMISSEANISVDGGVTVDNAAEITGAGADILIAGTAVFGAKDRAQAMRAMRVEGETS